MKKERAEKAQADHLAAYEKSVVDLVAQVKSKRVAKRDFVIHQNEYHFEIKAGDDLSHIPELFIENLKTENVI